MSYKLTKQEMIKLKEVNLSLGLMLESTSERLTKLNNPHFFAPSKWPKVRKKMLNILILKLMLFDKYL